MKPWLSSIIHYFFVASCDFCHRELRGKDFNRICLRCASRLDNTEGWRLCSRCGQSLNAFTYKPISEFSEQGDICDQCFNEPTPLDMNRSLFLNFGLAQRLIYDFKFKPHSSYSPIVVLWALKKIRPYLESFDIFIPIPLGKKGLYEREFCQVTKVSQKLAQVLKKPMHRAIIRNEKRYRQAQHHLTAAERKAGVEEKYLYQKKYHNRFTGKRVLVIDDIYTTGSTLINAARLIKEHNPDTVVGSFTFLRTIFEKPEVQSSGDGNRVQTS